MATEHSNLVVLPGKLGDYVVATPTFRAMKESFPDQPLHLLADDVFYPLLEGNPYLDKIIPISWRGPRRSWWDIYSSVRKNGPYQRAVILEANIEQWNWVLALNGIWKVAQIGGTLSAKLLGHRCIRRNWSKNHDHISKTFLKAAVALGASVPENGMPQLYLSDEERQGVLTRFPFLIGSGKIFIHAFGISTVSNLSPKSYFKVADYLAQNSGCRIYLIGTESELKKSNYLPIPGVSTELIGSLNIRELMAVCSHANLVIGGSSGVTHIASALGVPTLGLYCPNHHHHLMWNPLGPASKTLSFDYAICRHNGATSGPCQGPFQFCDIAFAFTNEQILAEANKLMERKTV